MVDITYYTISTFSDWGDHFFSHCYHTASHFHLLCNITIYAIYAAQYCESKMPAVQTFWWIAFLFTHMQKTIWIYSSISILDLTSSETHRKMCCEFVDFIDLYLIYRPIVDPVGNPVKWSKWLNMILFVIILNKVLRLRFTLQPLRMKYLDWGFVCFTTTSWISNAAKSLCHNNRFNQTELLG